MQAQWFKTEQSHSVLGRSITLHCNIPSPKALDALIIGVFHGDEPEAFQLANAFMCRFGSVDFQDKVVGIIPVLNPDGLAQQTRVNANGVDLNRNYPTANFSTDGQHTPYFGGHAAASEPETQFVLHLLKRYTPRCVITLHTPYAVINYDGPAEAVAAAMSQQNGYPLSSDIGYATPGSFGTYLGKEQGIPVITLELHEKDEYTPAIEEANLNALRAGILAV